MGNETGYFPLHPKADIPEPETTEDVQMMSLLGDGLVSRGHQKGTNDGEGIFICTETFLRR